MNFYRSAYLLVSAQLLEIRRLVNAVAEGRALRLVHAVDGDMDLCVGRPGI